VQEGGRAGEREARSVRFMCVRLCICMREVLCVHRIMTRAAARLIHR
jgi:hypothetical protein